MYGGDDIFVCVCVRVCVWLIAFLVALGVDKR